MEVSPTNYDFAGWATCCNVLCSDGRTIMPDAFAHQDGNIVPLVWNHQHDDIDNVLGKALLHSRDGGMYAYCLFNDTESGQAGKTIVQHGDVCSLSICANQLKHNSARGVTHGMIREVSLVLANANPGAYIGNVMKHGEECDDEAVIYTGEDIILFHADDMKKDEKEAEKVAEETKKTEETKTDKTVGEVWDGITKKLNEDEMNVVYAMIGEAAGGGETNNDDDEVKHSDLEGGITEMRTHNVFENDNEKQATVLTHADQVEIIKLAKQSGVGSLQDAIKMYLEDNSLAHGLDLGDTEVLEELLPDHKLLNPGAPEILRADQSWVMGVINKIHKSPYSRVRTRKADARQAELKAKGYKKGEEKKFNDHIKLLGRKTEPTTVYIKESLHRDDIVDIIDFDSIGYTWGMMKDTMYETLALSVLVGDGRDDTDPDKISETNIRPIWKDEELYTIHRDVDIEAAKAELQGTNTGANFGENYIYAEAMITAALYAREKYKGTGTPDYYCAPHSVNVMLLARDLNGRRIYDSKADLAKALNVGQIIEIEQLEGKTRKDDDGNTKKLHGIFVNLADYQLGSTKGGEITKFTDFNIDFNKYTYLMETRLSGALTEPFGAIALEEPVENVAG